MSKLSELPQKYPKLFKSQNEETCNPSYHFQCGDGWYFLLDHLLGLIQFTLGRFQDVQAIQQRLVSEGKDLKDYRWIEEYFQQHPEDPLTSFRIDQIKEKFGGLRFYWSGASGEEYHQIQGAVDLTESLSTLFCEVCGSNTQVETRASNGRYWIQTLCQTHRSEEEKPKETQNES